MSSANMHFAGIPVAPDVKLLMDHFGQPEVGTEIEHEAVEAVLCLPRKSGRYRTVVSRWMRTLWDQFNIRVVGIRGGFRVLTATERLDQSEHQRVKGVRRLTQAVKEVVTAPVAELPPEQITRRDHLARTNVLALAAVKDIQRDYGRALTHPPEPLPRRKEG